jgi:OOP family OmpA-OmpF porin
MMSKKLIALAAVVAGGMPIAASAGGFYVGAGIGSATYESADFVDCFGQCEQFKDSDFAYGLFAGYEVTDAVAVELGYWDWGSGDDTLDGVQAEVEPSMITIMAVGSAPIAENWELFGKAGVAWLDIDSSIVDGGEGASGSSDSQDLALGGGVQWDIGNFGIRGEALWVDAEDADQAMMFGVSGLWRFGG